MKIKYSKIGIKKLSITKAALKISFQNDAQIDNEKLIKFINNSQNNVSFTKENVLLYKKTFNFRVSLNQSNINNILSISRKYIWMLSIQ